MSERHRSLQGSVPLGPNFRNIAERFCTGVEVKDRWSWGRRYRWRCCRYAPPTCYCFAPTCYCGVGLVVVVVVRCW